MKSNKIKGFSLVELSIVLVIVGLIVGGILVGQELINSAKVRSAVSQLEKYRAAVAAFYVKYDTLPGDYNKATSALGAAADGNGDREIDGLGSYAFQFESFAFWDHLARANLISDPITYSTATVIVGSNIPKFKLGSPDSGLIPFSYIHTDWLRVSILSGNVAWYNDPVLGATLTPEQAFGIDSKMDDGKAISGAIVGVDGNHLLAGPSATCNDGNGVYLLSTKTPTCALKYDITN